MAVANAAAGHGPAGRDPLQFLSVPIGTTTLFTLFVGSALALRRKREWHKRLMLLATMTVAWACVHDWRRVGRVDPAYVVGGIALIVSIPLRRWIGFTDAWLPIARWLVS